MKHEIIKKLNKLAQDVDVSEESFYNTGYLKAINDAMEVVQNHEFDE